MYAPLKRSQTLSDAKTVKRDVFPRVNRKNASGTFSARCMTMHETEWRSVWARPVSQRLIFGCFRPPASFFRLLLVARSSTVTVPASQCWIQHRSTVSSTPPHKIRHCKQHRKGKIQPQSSTITGTVTVPDPATIRHRCGAAYGGKT